jgi:hypothetical protein
MDLAVLLIIIIIIIIRELYLHDTKAVSGVQHVVK